MIFFCYLFKKKKTVPDDPIWFLDGHDSGQMFWRRDSTTSKVKFRCEVEVLEFERDPEEDRLLSRGEYNHSFSDQKPTHPIVVGATCLCAIAITVLLPWLMVQSHEPID